VKRVTDFVMFTIPGRAPIAFSSNSGTAHWAVKDKAAKEYAERVVIAWLQSGYAVGQFGPWERAHMTLIQRACQLRDHDNFYSSFKPGQDALTVKGHHNVGLLADDTPQVLSVTLKAERVRHRNEESVGVRVERLPSS
jgi:hypothetical protein